MADHITDTAYRCPSCGRGVSIVPVGKMYDALTGTTSRLYAPLCAISGGIPWVNDDGSFRCWGDLADKEL